jgi:hypothetical protein
MSDFLSPLKINYIDGKSWEVAESFCYKVGSPTSNWEVHVPVGTVVDFASLPRLAQLIMPSRWRFSKASVLHDYMYRYGDKSKSIADAVFYEALLAEGINKHGAWLMTIAVSIFGGKAYKAGVHYSEATTEQLKETEININELAGNNDE